MTPMVLPQYQGSYYDLQNRQALAQALMGQATQNQASLIPTNMPVMPKYSIGAGLTQLGQAYLAAKLQNSVAQGYGDLGAQQMAYMRGGNPQQATAQQPQGQPTGTTPNPFAGDQGGATAGTVAAGAPAAGAAPSAGDMFAPGGALNPSGRDPSAAVFSYYTLGPEKYSEQFVAPYVKPTDATLMARAAGTDPAAANAGALFKNNFVAPVTGTGIFRDPRTMQPVANNPEIQKGAEPIFNAGGQVIGQRLLDGTLTAIRNERAAEELGAGSALPAQPQYDAAGNPLPTMSRTASITGGSTGGAAPTLSQIFAQQESSGGKTAPDNPMQIQQGTFKQFAQPGESWNNVSDRTTVANRVLAGYQQKYGGDLGRIATAYFSGEGNVAPAGSPTPFIKNVSDSNGKSVASYVGDIYGRSGGGSSATPGGGNYPVQPPGVIANANAAATNQQGELSKKWTDLTAQNQQAQITTSYLQNIKALASKANLGQMSDQLAYANSLLALAGSPKAQDTVTANNLLDKYQNQIISRLGQGGMGTDSARSILESAYPGRKMNEGAIGEAADNLVGANQMVQAKTRLLAPYRNKNDAQGYTNAEIAFDQSADPRIFQYANIKDPAARKTFAQNLMQQDPSIVQKIQTLQSLGALK